MEFVDSTMFPRYDAGMLAAVGWAPPAGTTGLGQTRAVQPFSCQVLPTALFRSGLSEWPAGEYDFCYDPAVARLGDLTMGEQMEVYGRTYDHFIAGFVNATLVRKALGFL
jgi:hypothetical protein